MVVEVASRRAWHDFEARLRAHGLQPDATSPVICRWRGTDGELLLDVMPSDASLLGFENRWQRPALDHAVRLEASKGRGRGDHLRSHDLEDVILPVDGRSEIVDEVAAAPDDLRAFVAQGTVVGFRRRIR